MTVSLAAVADCTEAYSVRAENRMCCVLWPSRSSPSNDTRTHAVNNFKSVQAKRDCGLWRQSE